MSAQTALRSNVRKASTERDLQFADYAGQVAAINKSQAVIEFHPDGTIITANDNFLKLLGYRLEEVKEQHHSMFVETAYRNSTEYGQFWRALSSGEFQSGEYKRIAKRAGKSGFRPATTRSRTPVVSRIKW